MGDPHLYRPSSTCYAAYFSYFREYGWRIHYAKGEYMVAKQFYQSIVDQFHDNLSKIMVEKCDLNN
jgi:hypothetical protein